MLRILGYISAIILALIAITFLLWHAFDYQLLRIYSGPQENIELDIEESENPAEFIKDHPPGDLSVALNLTEVRNLEADNQIELSEAGYRQAIKDYSFDPAVTYQYAAFLARKGAFNRAATQLRSGSIKNDPEGLAHFLNCYETSLSCAPLSTETQGDFWAHLINNLEVRDLDSAEFLINQNPYRIASWHPDLLATLSYLVSYQQGRTLTTFDMPKRRSAEDSSLKELVDELNALATLERTSPSIKVSSAMRKLLISKEAFALALSAAKLHEAAAKLHEEEVYSQEYPSWAALAMTNSLKKARGPKVAYNFALLQSQSDALQLEIGDLLLELGDKTKAIALLSSLSTQQTKVGADALYLLANEAYIEGNLDSAKKMVNENPRLSTTVEGKELLAKIALEQSDFLDAERHYSSISTVSKEAKVYYAKKALKNNESLLAEKIIEEIRIDSPTLTKIR